jgi:ligand-binding SRPBCC domain-containing protein
MSDFARLAGQQCPPQAALALELALELVDPARIEALVDPRTLGADLTWRCAHEVTGVVLRHVTATAERSGDLTRSLGASALLLALPVDATSRSAQQAVHQRLLSRLN